MKLTIFIFFLSVVFLMNAAINYYIIRRGLQVIPDGSNLRKILVISVIILASSFFAGRIIERFSINPVSEILIWAGSFWMAFMLYILIMLVFIDELRLLNHWFGIFPSFITNNPEKSKTAAAWIVIVISSVLVFAGHLNTYFPAIRKYEIPINKSAGSLKELNIAVASDIHLGTIIGRKKMEMFAEKINSLKPDIILLPGDIIDEDIAPVLEDNMGSSLEMLKAKYGVYAVTGNHEYIGGAEKAVEFLEKHKIKIIRDTSVFIDNSFYVAGREDYSSANFGGKPRKILKDVIENVNFDFPVILMDHQPFNLDEARKTGVDLQLSGHTHHGQLWPLNLITALVYEKSWGFLKKGNTNYYISSGLGGWGPPVRTVNRPEIIHIKLKFVAE